MLYQIEILYLLYVHELYKETMLIYELHEYKYMLLYLSHFLFSKNTPLLSYSTILVLIKYIVLNFNTYLIKVSM